MADQDRSEKVASAYATGTLKDPAAEANAAASEEKAAANRKAYVLTRAANAKDLSNGPSTIAHAQGKLDDVGTGAGMVDSAVTDKQKQDEDQRKFEESLNTVGASAPARPSSAQDSSRFPASR